MSCDLFIDSCEQKEWDKCAEFFYDNNIYQTWAYQKVRAEKAGQDLKRVMINII